MLDSISRRDFLKQGSVLTAGLATLGSAVSVRAAKSPNEKVVIAIVGCNNRGMAHIAGYLPLPNAEIAYICDVDSRAVEKGVACYPRVEGNDPLSDGVPMETRCMAVCPGKIRMNGLVDIAEDGSWVESPQHPLYHLIKVEKLALPLYPQFGTEPNIYYIPPRWAPRTYLHQMFGPGVEDAIARYTAPSRETLAVLQLFRTTQKMIFRYEIKEGPLVVETVVNGKPWQMYNDTVIGFDAKGREVARLSNVEPIHQRPAERPNSI
jgi:nitrate reductase beta subunit